MAKAGTACEETLEGLPPAEDSTSMTSRVRRPPSTAGTANIMYKNLDRPSPAFKHPEGRLPWAPPLSTASVRWRDPTDYCLRHRVAGARYFATYAAATSPASSMVRFPRAVSAPSLSGSLSGGSHRPTSSTTTSSRLGTPFALPKVSGNSAGCDRCMFAAKAPVCEYNFLRPDFYVIQKSDG
eukprot:CAMPEP_0115237380 /NCGR_PEP_ID=MMETSP0270-20121206/36333_1 /TAXON_ID=71861 /ORGANISM="Scrippsiella trochoidea, Strain CCMP3099" /LENGTH=181 /DNA_ID=CAMNT_0002652265 /DNA_START=25 /DNA_END=570 /DNA_ORIENTATION=+